MSRIVVYRFSCRYYRQMKDSDAGTRSGWLFEFVMTSLLDVDDEA